MIVIGICDDDPHFIDELHEIIEEFMNPISDWQLRIFHSGDEVIAAIRNHLFDCNLLFMDIYMENTNGIETARYIYEHNTDTDLIFITGASNYVFECYHYNTFAYLLKPLSRTDIVTELNRYFSEIEDNPKCLNISIRGTNHRIPLNSILYIESDLRTVKIHTKYKDYDYYQKLSVLEETLRNDGFIRCHQSYLIAADKLTSYNANELYIGDIKLPVSRKYQEDIRRFFEGSKSESAATTEPGCYLTSSINMNQRDSGAFVCIEGVYIGAIIRIKP